MDSLNLDLDPGLASSPQDSSGASQAAARKRPRPGGYGHLRDEEAGRSPRKAGRVQPRNPPSGESAPSRCHPTLPLVLDHRDESETSWIRSRFTRSCPTEGSALEDWVVWVIRWHGRGRPDGQGGRGGGLPLLSRRLRGYRGMMTMIGRHPQLTTSIPHDLVPLHPLLRSRSPPTPNPSPPSHTLAPCASRCA